MDNHALTSLMEKLDAVSLDIREIKLDISGIQTDISDLKTSISHAGDTAQKALDKTGEQNDKFIEVDSQLTGLENNFGQIVKENRQLNEQLLQNECQNKRSNLIFEGIPEQTDESDNDSLESVYQILVNKMGLINARDIKVARCHRKHMLRHVFDRYTQHAKPRLIIMKLHYYPYRECIWKARSSLKGSQYWLSEDFPQEIVKQRHILNSIRRKAVQEGKKASVSVDRLYIEGQMYTIDNLINLPESLELAEVSTKRFTLYTAFFSQHSKLSNFHLARFIKDAIQYENNEYFYQHKRAI